MGSCSKWLGMLFVLLLVLSAPLALILTNLDSYLLSPEPYLQALDEEAFQERLPEVISNQIRYSLSYNPCLADPQMCEGGVPAPGGSSPPSYLSGLTEEEWQGILDSLLDPVWMQEQTEAVLQAVFDNLEPGVEPVPVKVSLSEVKTRLSGEAGLALVRDLLATRPSCTSEQLQELIAQQETGADPDKLLACNPPVEILTAIEPELRQALVQAAAGLPESVELTGLEQFMQFNPVQDGGGAGLDLSMVRLWMRYSWLLPALCVLLIFIFSVRSIQDLGRWVGLPFFIVGLSMSAIMLLLPGMLNWIIDGFILGALPGALSASTSSFVVDFVRGVSQSTSTRIGLQALFLFILGGILILVASFTRRRRSVDTIPPLTRPRGENQGGG